MHELDTGKPTDNPETSKFQGIIFGRESKNITDILGTDGDVYTLQILGEGTSVPAQSLLHLNTTEVLNVEESEETSHLISDKFTTKELTATLVSATTFCGSLSGNATTATNLNSARTFSFTGGDISGSASSNTGGYSITAAIINGAVTNDKIAKSTIKTEKLGFDVTMTLSVEEEEGDENNEHMTLTLCAPTLSNK